MTVKFRISIARSLGEVLFPYAHTLGHHYLPCENRTFICISDNCILSKKWSHLQNQQTLAYQFQQFFSLSQFHSTVNMCGCYDMMKLCTTSSGSSSQMDAGSMTSPVSPALGVSNLKTWAVSTLRAGTPGTLGTWRGKCGMSGMTSKLIDSWQTQSSIYLQEQSYRHNYRIMYSVTGWIHLTWIRDKQDILFILCFIVAVSCAVAKHEQYVNDIKIST